MFDWRKKSKGEQIRENADQGKSGEEKIRREYELSGHEVERTGRGHDYKVSKRNWFTGKKESKYVEVKTGNSELSPLQKKKKRQFGSRYVEERLEPTPFGFTSQNNDNLFVNNSPKKRSSKKRYNPFSSDSSFSIFGSSSPRKKKRTSRKKSDSIWGSSGSTGSIFGSSSPRKKKRTSRKKSDSIW